MSLGLIYLMMLINNTIYHSNFDVIIFFDFFNKNIIFVSIFLLFCSIIVLELSGCKKTYLKQCFLSKCFILFNAHGIKLGLANVPATLLAPELWHLDTYTCNQKWRLNSDFFGIYKINWTFWIPFSSFRHNFSSSGHNFSGFGHNFSSFGQHFSSFRYLFLSFGD